VIGAREVRLYRLAREPGELDLERFERLAARGRSGLADGQAEVNSGWVGVNVIVLGGGELTRG
jgi:hypothetical protein